MGLQDRCYVCNRAGRSSLFKGVLLFFCLLFTGVSFSSSKDSILIKNKPLINSVPGLSIQADSNGHYRGTVLINNVAMPFLIDTGATKIVVPAKMAYSARLPLGKAVQTSTSNGFAVNRLTRINNLKIGNMEISNLDASVTDRLDEVLVGMSFLKLFRMTQDKNVLTLTLAPGGTSNIESVLVDPVLSQQPSIKSELTRENSSKAYILARNEVSGFKAQYKKPIECYDMKNGATRMRCANAFIKARQDYEALNK